MRDVVRLLDFIGHSLATNREKVDGRRGSPGGGREGASHRWVTVDGEIVAAGVLPSQGEFYWKVSKLRLLNDQLPVPAGDRAAQVHS